MTSQEMRAIIPLVVVGMAALRIAYPTLLAVVTAWIAGRTKLPVEREQSRTLMQTLDRLSEGEVTESCDGRTLKIRIAPARSCRRAIKGPEIAEA
jgi:Na+/melibiose symporter-like transporter